MWSLHLIPKTLLAFCVISETKSRSIIALDAARVDQSEELFASVNLSFCCCFLKFLFIFREGEGGRKRGGEISMCGWVLLLFPQLGTWPTTQACALTGNRTSDPLAYRPGTQSTEPHQPGIVSLPLPQRISLFYRISFYPS